MKNKMVKWIVLSISILLGLLLVGGVYFSYQVGKSVGEGCLEIGRNQDTKNNSIKQMEIWGFDQDAFEATYSSEYIELTAKDGNKVPTYYYRMNEKEAVNTVILVHGLGGEALCMEPWIEMYGEKGYNVLAIDTRGAGKNKDVAMTYGHNETMDLEASVDYLRAKIGSHKIIIHGQSLGGCMVGGYEATEHANQNVDTIISVGVHLFEMLCGFGEQNTHLNALFMLYCTIVGVIVLSMHYLFEEVSTIVMVLLQYVVAIGLVLGSVFVLSFFIAVDSHGYFEMWRSFSIIYALGAISYYVSLYIEVNKQNNLLNEIKLNDLERKRN